MAHSILVEGLHHGSNPIPAAARRGPLVVSGGIAGLDRTSGTLPDSLEEQVANMFDNVGAIITEAGGSVADIVKMTIAVGDRSARSVINPHWVAMFPDESSRPARHTVAKELSGGMLVQADFVAYIPD